MSILSEKYKNSKQGLYNVPTEGEALQRADPTITSSQARVYDITHQNTRDVTDAVNAAKSVYATNIYGGDIAAIEHARELREQMDEKLKAEKQGVMTKAGNALVQTVGELILGTLSGLSRILDPAIYGYDKLTGQDYNFENPIADAIDSVNEYVRNDLAPIYSYGTDVGYFLQQAPTIGTIASFLIPTKALGGAANWIGKAGKAAQMAVFNTTLTNKLVRMAATAAKAKEVSKLNSAIKIAEAEGRTADVAKLGNELRAVQNSTFAKYRAKVTAFQQNALESAAGAYIWNVAEARSNYTQTYQERKAQLDELTDEELTEFYNRNPQFKGMDKDEIAKKMAHDVATDTFITDTWTFAAFNYMMTRAAQKLMFKGDAMNSQPLSRMGEKYFRVKMAETFGKTVEADALKRTFIDWLPTGYQAKHYAQEALSNVVNVSGRHIVADIKRGDPDEYFGAENYRSLSDYLDDPDIWMSAFWATIGGIGFGKIKKLFSYAGRNAKALYKYKIGLKDKDGERHKISKDEYQLERASTEKQRIHRMISLGKRFEAYTDYINDINSGRNPFEKERDIYGKPIKDEETGLDMKAVITSDAEKQALKDRAFEELLIHTTLDAADGGVFDLYKQWLTNKDFHKYLEQKIDGYDANEEINIGERIAREAESIYNDYIDLVHQYSAVAGKNLDSIDFVNEGNELIKTRNNPIVIRNSARQTLIDRRYQEKFDNWAEIAHESAISQFDSEHLERYNLAYDIIKIRKLHQRYYQYLKKYNQLNKIFNNRELGWQNAYKELIDIKNKLTEIYGQMMHIASFNDVATISFENGKKKLLVNDEIRNRVLNDLSKYYDEELQGLIKNDPGVEVMLREVIKKYKETRTEYGELTFGNLAEGFATPAYEIDRESKQQSYEKLTQSQHRAIENEVDFEMMRDLQKANLPVDENDYIEKYIANSLQFSQYTLAKLEKYAGVLKDYLNDAKDIEDLNKRYEELINGSKYRELTDENSGVKDKDLSDALLAMSYAIGNSDRLMYLLVTAQAEVAQRINEREAKEERDKRTTVEGDEVKVHEEVQEEGAPDDSPSTGETKKAEVDITPEPEPKREIKDDDLIEGKFLAQDQDEDKKYKPSREEEALFSKEKEKVTINDKVWKTLSTLSQSGEIDMKELANKATPQDKQAAIDKIVNEMILAEPNLNINFVEKLAAETLNNALRLLNNPSSGMQTLLKLASGLRVENAIVRRSVREEMLKDYEDFLQNYFENHGTILYKSTTGSEQIVTQPYVNVARLLEDLIADNRIDYQTASQLFLNLNNLIIATRDKYKYVGYDANDLINNPTKILDMLWDRKVRNDTSAEYFRISEPSETYLAKRYNIKDDVNKRENIAIMQQKTRIAKMVALNGWAPIRIVRDRNGSSSLSLVVDVGFALKIDTGEYTYDDTGKATKEEIEIGYIGQVNPSITNNGYRLSLVPQKGGFYYNVWYNAVSQTYDSNIDTFFEELVLGTSSSSKELREVIEKLFTYRYLEGGREYSEKDLDIVRQHQLIKNLINNNVYYTAFSNIMANKVKGSRVDISKAGELTAEEKKEIYRETAKLVDAIISIRYHTSETTGEYGTRDWLINANSDEIMDSIQQWKYRLFANYKQTHQLQTQIDAGKTPEIHMPTLQEAKFEIDPDKPINIDEEFMKTNGFVTYETNAKGIQPVKLIYTSYIDNDPASENVMKIEGEDHDSYVDVGSGLRAGGLTGIRVGIRVGNIQKNNRMKPVVVYMDNSNYLYDPTATRKTSNAGGIDMVQKVTEEIEDIINSRLEGEDISEVYDRLNDLLGRFGLFYGYRVWKTANNSEITIRNIDDGKVVLTIFGKTKSGSNSRVIRMKVHTDEGEKDYYSHSIEPDAETINASDIAKMLITGEYKGVQFAGYRKKGLKYNMTYPMLSDTYGRVNRYIERNTGASQSFLLKLGNDYRATKQAIGYNNVLDYIVKNSAYTTNFQYQDTSRGKSSYSIENIPINASYASSGQTREQKGFYVTLKDPAKVPPRPEPNSIARRNNRWTDKIQKNGKSDATNMKAFFTSPVEDGGLGVSEESYNLLYKGFTHNRKRISLLPNVIKIPSGDPKSTDPLDRISMANVTGKYDPNAEIEYNGKTEKGVILLSNVALAGMRSENGVKTVIRTILHENLHRNIDQNNANGNFHRFGKEIIETMEYAKDALEEQRDTMDRHLYRKLNEIISVLQNLESYGERISDSVNGKRTWSALNEEEKSALLAEEIVVESFTDSDLATFLNSVKWKANVNIKNYKNKTLLQKIVNALLRFFNIQNINDDTILARQFELLAKEIKKADIERKEVKKEDNKDEKVIVGTEEEKKIKATEITDAFAGVKQGENFAEDHKYTINGVQNDVSVTEALHPLNLPPSITIVSTSLGNNFDTAGRRYYLGNNGSVDNMVRPKLTLEEFKNLSEDDLKFLQEDSGDGRPVFEHIRDRITEMVSKANGGTNTAYRIFTNEIPIAAKWTHKTTGETKLVAGTMDMLVIDANGNYYILDFKTSHNFEDNERTLKSNVFSGYVDQVNHYRMIIETNLPQLKGKFKGQALIVVGTSWEAKHTYTKGKAKDEVLVDGNPARDESGLSYIGFDKSFAVIDVPITDKSDYIMSPIDKVETSPKEPVKYETESKKVEEAETEPKETEVKSEEPAEPQEQEQQAEPPAEPQERTGRRRSGKRKIDRSAIIRREYREVNDISGELTDREKDVEILNRDKRISISGITETESMNDFVSRFTPEKRKQVAEMIDDRLLNFVCV